MLYIPSHITTYLSLFCSTDKDRSIAAAYSTLAGIVGEECLSDEWIQKMPPIADIISPLGNKEANSDRQAKHKHQLKIPKIDPHADFMHRSAWIKCKKLLQLNKKGVTIKRREHFLNNIQFYKELSEVVGFNLTSFDEAKSVYESYQTEFQVKSQYSKWMDDAFLNELLRMYLHDYTLYFPARINGILSGGPTVATIVQKIQKVVSRKLNTENKKDTVMMLFGHTSSLMAVTKTLGKLLLLLQHYSQLFSAFLCWVLF